MLMIDEFCHDKQEEQQLKTGGKKKIDELIQYEIEKANEHNKISILLKELKEYRETNLTPIMIKDLIKSEKRAHNMALEAAEKIDGFQELEEEIRKKAIDDYKNRIKNEINRFHIKDIETDLLFAVLDGMARQLKKGGEQTDDN